jgi:hypothetical protein
MKVLDNNKVGSRGQKLAELFYKCSGSYGYSIKCDHLVLCKHLTARKTNPLNVTSIDCFGTKTLANLDGRFYVGTF